MLTLAIKGEFPEKQIEYANQHSQAIELRLDLIPSYDIGKLRTLCNVPVIFTLRKKSHGGAFTGTEKEREEALEKLASHKPDYLDIEWDTGPAFAKKIQEKYPSIKIICSYHNFEETPLDLNSIFEKMQTFPADHYKMATMAKSALDSLRMLNFIKESKNLTGLCMGAYGECSRILSPLFGNQFNFVSKEMKEKTAPGQMSLESLESIYHYSKLNSHTKIYALIGDPDLVIILKAYSQGISQ